MIHHEPIEVDNCIADTNAQEGPCVGTACAGDTSSMDSECPLCGDHSDLGRRANSCPCDVCLVPFFQRLSLGGGALHGAASGCGDLHLLTTNHDPLCAVATT